MCPGGESSAPVAAWRTHLCEHIFARGREGVHMVLNAARVGACATSKWQPAATTRNRFSFLQNVDRSADIRRYHTAQFQPLSPDKVTAHIRRERRSQPGHSKLNCNVIALIGQRSNFAAQ